MTYDKKNGKKSVCLAEFLLVSAVFVLSPVFTARSVSLPKAPDTLFLTAVFIVKTVFAAAYEEALYRVYLPFRLHSFCTEKAAPFNRSFLLSELPPILFFALAHRYAGVYTVLYACAAGCLFRFIYKKLAGRYSRLLGFISVCALHSAHNLAVFYGMVF